MCFPWLSAEATSKKKRVEFKRGKLLLMPKKAKGKKLLNNSLKIVLWLPYVRRLVTCWQKNLCKIAYGIKVTLKLYWVFSTRTWLKRYLKNESIGVFAVTFLDLANLQVFLKRALNSSLKRKWTWKRSKAHSLWRMETKKSLKRKYFAIRRVRKPSKSN